MQESGKPVEEATLESFTFQKCMGRRVRSTVINSSAVKHVTEPGRCEQVWASAVERGRRT